MRMVEPMEQGEEVDQHRVIADKGKEETVMNTDEQGEEVEQQLPITEKSAEEPTVQQDEVLEIVRQIDTEVEPSSIAEMPEETQAESTSMEMATVNEPIEEAEQPLLTPEEVAGNLVARDSEATKTDMDVDENRTVGWDSTKKVEKAIAETPEDREVVIVTDEEEKTEKVPLIDEATGARASAIRTYQGMPAREETSGRRSEEEQPRETPGQRARKDVDSPVGSAVGPLRRRMRLLIDEEEDVFFSPIGAQPRSGRQIHLLKWRTVKEKGRSEKERGKPLLSQ